MKKISLVLLIASSLLATNPSYAEENDNGLIKQIKTLRKQVEKFQKQPPIQAGVCSGGWWDEDPNKYRSLMKGAGDRSESASVAFKTTYPDGKPPHVYVSISYFNFLDPNPQKSGEPQHQILLNATAKNITESGFDCDFQIWGNTLLAGARLTWIAFPGE